MSFEEEAKLYEEEACAEFAKESGYGDIEGVNTILRRGMRIVQKAREEIAHGVTVQEWISVEDRLPEEKQDVLLFFGAVEGCVGMAVGFYEIEDEIPAWYGKSDGEFYSDCWQWPTHWMPLPERPALKE